MRRHPMRSLVTGVQTCALPLSPNEPPMMTVNLGTCALATACTSLAPSLAMPRLSYSRPTMKPVMFCKNTNGILRWQHSSMKCAPLSADSENRSEEHTSELKSLMRLSYAVFCLKKKINNKRSTIKLDNQNRNKHLDQFGEENSTTNIKKQIQQEQTQQQHLNT